MTVNRANRRGIALIPALVCLVLVGLLCAGVLRTAHIQRGLVENEEQRMQSEWLVESGLARAAARLAANPDYQGETWVLSASSLGGRDAGVVTIAVKPLEKSASRRRVRVEADYPSGDPTRRARQSKQLIVDVGTDQPRGPS